ncbi:MAG TPA: quinoprotein dehydrogenase-associated putative ABC transporter substrate-binding protein [Candidatus Udaeobacter sp.]|nr:quinoprotein dehydrogenase-associated putative ABC transporter substrate-binding protein [Candidatus Udaeobacter sp.]
MKNCCLTSLTRAAFLFVCCAGFVTSVAAQQSHVLRVAADPNNLPFSNQRKEGFENKIAELLARELNCKLEYHWHAQRRGFFRETLKSGDVDLVVGVPAHFDMALTTAPIYRSSFVFVARADRQLHITSLDDVQLPKLKIGVQLIGNDGVDTPPAQAVAARGLVQNVRGYTLYGDYTRENPPAQIMDAVVQGDVDLAIVWGPLAGFYAKRSRVALEIVPVQPQKDHALYFAFDIAIGVQKQNRALKDKIDNVLAAHHDEIESILDAYNVPRVGVASKRASL